MTSQKTYKSRNEGWKMKDEGGFADRQMVIGDCRVAFATENSFAPM